MDEGCAPICFRCASENDSSTYCVRAMKDGVGGDLIYIYRPPFSKKWKRSIHIDCTKAAEISWKPITETVVDIIYFFEEFFGLKQNLNIYIQKNPQEKRV